MDKGKGYCTGIFDDFRAPAQKELLDAAIILLEVYTHSEKQFVVG
jgi:hypothetical protein